MKEYNKIIRELREDHDLKQKDIAKLLGTTQQVYSRYENGENEIPVRHIITLCKFYNVSADYILGLKKIQCTSPVKTDNRKNRPLMVE